MAFYSASDFVQEAGQQLSLYDRQYSRFEQLRADTKAKQTDLQDRLREAYVALSEAVLSDLSEPAFRNLATRFNLPDLMRVYERATADAQRIATRIAQIDQSPVFQDREQRLYEIDKQINENEPLYQIARRDFDYLNSLPRFRELVARDYGTPNYPHKGILRFFNGEYLADWRRADEILAETGAASFPELSARWHERQEQVRVLGRTVGELRAEADSIQNLVQERYNLLQEQQNLPQKARLDAGRVLAQHLKNADISSLPNADVLQGRLTMIDGMEHQVKYLDDLADKIEQDATGLAERADKLRMERERYASDPYRYRNKRFTGEQWNKRFDRRRIDRYEVLHDRYARAGTTIYVFDDYYRVSPLEQFLWWDVMTDGRLDGNFIPEVAEYRAMHPDYAYERPAYYGGDSGGGSYTSGGFDVFDSSNVGDGS